MHTFNLLELTAYPVNRFPVFFDRRVGAFVQVRRIRGDYAVCGGYTNYYFDTATMPRQQLIPLYYFDNTESMQEVNHNLPEFAEYDHVLEVWRVKDVKISTADLTRAIMLSQEANDEYERQLAAGFLAILQES